MTKTRKVQVTLEESQYEALENIAKRGGKKLAAVVRESIVKYCLGPESKKARQRALESLFAESAPVPEDYRDWEKQYGAAKTEVRPHRQKREGR